MRTRIKFCGLRDPAHVQLAGELGVDAIGLNFYPPSPRAISRTLAAELCAATPPFVTRVALFLDAEADAVDAEHQSADEEEEERDAAPSGEESLEPDAPDPETPRVDAENAPAKSVAKSEHEESFDDEEEMWMTDEEKAALAERVAAKARRVAKALHVKCAY